MKLLCRKGRCLVKVRAMEGRAPQLPVTKYDVEVPETLSDLAANASRIYTDESWTALPYSNMPLAKQRGWRSGRVLSE